MFDSRCQKDWMTLLGKRRTLFLCIRERMWYTELVAITAINACYIGQTKRHLERRIKKTL